jgi:hypothetical protein
MQTRGNALHLKGGGGLFASLGAQDHAEIVFRLDKKI